MPVDAGSPVAIENGKSKKSKRNKMDVHEEDGSAVGDPKRKKSADDIDDAEERKHKKKKRKSEVADRGEEGAADTSSHAPTDTAVNDAKAEKRKRKKVAEEAAVVPPIEDLAISDDPPKKKKKKSKRDVEAVDEATAGDASTSIPEEALPRKEKKSKKSKKAAAQAEEEPSVPSAPSTSTAIVASTSPANAAAFLEKHSVTITVPDGTEQVLPVTSFAALSLPDALSSAFASFEEPTPIQACSWPPALEGKDVVGIAETGSGKTLAFGIPALSRLLSSPTSKISKKGKSNTSSEISVLVVAPTRELAIQTHDTLSALGGPLGIGSAAVFGGVDKGAQARMLRSGVAENGGTVRIVVGTPGRIIDLVADEVLDLSHVNYLVLDEADRMLDKGFENDIRRIISYTVQGDGRQTLMFSATWPESVRRLASTFQRNPVRVTVGSDDLTANSRVEQVLEVFDDGREKDSRLLNHLRILKHPKTPASTGPNRRILVFVLYKKEASRVETMLKSKGFSVQAIHGDMSQTGRIAALQSFKDGTTNTLVATDVAARGLDIPDVAVVLNYSFPLTIEDYIHRIGRTGRGGKSGKSITFFTGIDHERALAGELARVLGDSGYDCAELREKFPMTIKKKQHGVYGAFFRDDIPAPKGPTKIKF